MFPNGNAASLFGWSELNMASEMTELAEWLDREISKGKDEKRRVFAKHGICNETDYPECSGDYYSLPPECQHILGLLGSYENIAGWINRNIKVEI